MNIVLYESTARYDKFIRALLGFVYAVLILGFIGTYLDKGQEGALPVLIPVVLVTLVLYLVMPRRYQVLDDRIRVVLGPPLSFSIGFSAVREVTQKRGVWLSVNFVTTVSSKYVVYILRHRGLAVAITPSEPQSFITALEQAMLRWQRTGSQH